MKISRVLTQSKFVSISCGSRTSLGVTENGRVIGWGSAGRKVLGEDIEEETIATPRTVENLENMTDIATRGSHAISLNKDGQLYTWGKGEQDYHSETKVSRLRLPQVTITKIGAGRMHSVAVDSHGNLYTWGYSDEGKSWAWQIKYADTIEQVKQDSLTQIS